MIIKYKKGICSDCGQEKTIYHKSRKLCSSCNSKRLAKKAKERYISNVEKDKALDYKKLDKFYKEFWDSNKVKECYETKKPLYKFHKWHVHHLIEKHLYPQAAFDFENCVLLTLEQHSLWHHITDKRKQIMMPNTYERYLKIKEKYGIE